MNVLTHLQPKAVFSHFEAICAIPHGSGNTAALADYCVRFAASHGLRHHRDAAGNVIIYQNGTAGYESAPTVILQGHLDMVAEKAPDCLLDLTKDGLRLRLEGDHIFAEGTTLGGDDGIAVAMILAVLESGDLPHPPIEAVFTAEEETGMSGAEALDGSLLRGRLLLNIDSEVEGVLTVGCAGSGTAAVSVPLESGACALSGIRVRISGLSGGHSGIDINKGRANAAVLLGRLLQQFSEHFQARLVRAECGNKDNAIPVLADAELALEDAYAEQAQALCARAESDFRREYAASDPQISVFCTPLAYAGTALTALSTQKVCAFLALAPNGVAEMSFELPGTVQTSCNLGVLRIGSEGLRAALLVRSSLESQKQMLLDRIRLLAEGLGGTLCVRSSIPAWEYRPHSALLELMCAVYSEMYGKTPAVESVHAGLECGIFCGKLEGLEAVSFGPDLTAIHSVHEKMSVSSVQRVWEYLCRILTELKNWDKIRYASTFGALF